MRLAAIVIGIVLVVNVVAFFGMMADDPPREGRTMNSKVAVIALLVFALVVGLILWKAFGQ